MTVLITGSRGKVAATLIPLLREKGIAVRAASASPDKLSVPAGVERVVCDLDDPATFPAALDGVESVFLYANPKHIEAFLAAAKGAGVQHIVLLSSSSVLEPGADTNAIAAMHSAVERGLERSGIRTTFLRPGGFAGNALGWSWAAKSTGSVDLPYPETQASPIHEAESPRPRSPSSPGPNCAATPTTSPAPRRSLRPSRSRSSPRPPGARSPSTP